MKRLKTFSIAIVLLASSLASAGTQPTEPQTPVPGASPLCDFKALDAISTEEYRDLLQFSCGTCEYDKKTNTVSNCPAELTEADKRHCKVMLWSEAAYRDPKYRKCGNFLIDGNGKLGNMGKVVLNQIIANVKSDCTDGTPAAFLANNANLAKICPRFNKFDMIERIEFYVYLMENLAYRELSCNEKGPDNTSAPTTTAVCMFQLEGSPQVRRSRPLSCRGSEAYIRSDLGCGKCAVDIMQWSLNASNVSDGSGYALPDKPFGTLDGPNRIRHSSYWFALNPDLASYLKSWKEENSKHLTPHEGLLEDLKWFPLCYDTPPAP